jgi:hypothetical protein
VVTRPLVWLSVHALERVAERVDVVDVGEVIVAEVADAIVAGRVACRKPRLLVPRGRRPRALSASARFCWTADMERVFVVKRVRSPRGERGVIVLTVLTPFGVDGFLSASSLGVATDEGGAR